MSSLRDEYSLFGLCRLHRRAANIDRKIPDRIIHLSATSVSVFGKTSQENANTDVITQVIFSRLFLNTLIPTIPGGN